MILLQNAAGDRGISMTFPLEQLPCVTLWKNLTALEEGYVTGLEPGTGFPYNRRIERKAGRVPKLEPNQTRRFTIEFSVLTSNAEVREANRMIARIQGGKKMEMDAAPEKIE